MDKELKKMEQTICEKVSMDVLQKVLKEDDFCETMGELDFELFGYDKEYPDDYYFMAKDNSLIIFVSKVNAMFYTYPMERKMDLL